MDHNAIKSENDSFITMMIYIATAIGCLLLVCYTYFNSNNKKKKRNVDFHSQSLSSSSFQIPIERQLYIDAVENNADTASLKTLLMKRAVSNCTLIEKLQEKAVGGNEESFERLYKKGLISDTEYQDFIVLREYVHNEWQDVVEQANKLCVGWGVDPQTREKESKQYKDEFIWYKANNIYAGLKKLTAAKSSGSINNSNNSGNNDTSSNIIDANSKISGSSNSISSNNSNVSKVPLDPDEVARQLIEDEERLERKRNKKNKKNSKK